MLQLYSLNDKWSYFLKLDAEVLTKALGYEQQTRELYETAQSNL